MTKDKLQSDLVATWWMLSWVIKQTIECPENAQGCNHETANDKDCFKCWINSAKKAYDNRTES